MVDKPPVEFPKNHKNVFLLDHTPYFGISCDKHVEFGFSRSRPGLIPLRPISKSLWTCSVEAAIEYSRVVWDLFPEGKLIRFVISDSHGRILNSWSPEQQNIYRVLGSLSGCGAPPRLNATTITIDYSVIHGFRTAVEAICECSELQHSVRNSVAGTSDIENRCRVICITSARDDESIKNLENIFFNELESVNKIAKSSDHLVPITYCNLLLINTFPNSANPAVTGHPPIEISPIFSTEVIKVAAFNNLASKLLNLLLNHYDLASTTITGIPMKEEQNASSSANYDVEIYHLSSAHISLFLTGRADLKQVISLKEGSDYNTVTLKWSTPRGAASVPDISSCSTLHRLTPVDVNSRPSACLITFLLNGRMVMLESPCADGSKIITHVLTSYGGEIFMQAVNVGYNIFNKITTIEEGLGGAVPDYRIQEFSSFISSRKLLPLKRKYLEDCNETNSAINLPIEQSLINIEKETKFWPLTESSNIIFNMKELTEPLLLLIPKEKLTQEDILRCKLCIYNLAYIDVRKREPFPFPAIFMKRQKIPRRHEQFRLMWSEIILYIKAFNQSIYHENILMCVYECRKKTEPIILLEKLELERALKDIENDKQQMLRRDTVIRATTDSPMSPPLVQQDQATPAINPLLSPVDTNVTEPKSVAEIWYEFTFTPKSLVSLPPYKRLENFKRTEEGGYYSKPFPFLSDSDSDEAP